MSAVLEAVPISTRSRDCLVAFGQCLSNARHPSLSVRQYSKIEDQMARFSVWTSNMAVFAGGKACLDHRLREAKDVHRLILGMLEALETRITECETLVLLLAVTRDESSQDSLNQFHDGFESSTTALASQVGLFHEVSNLIRKASKQSQNDNAVTSFCIKDQEGNDLEAMLKRFFSENLCDRFPDSDTSIRERLAATMILRRKRILYRRTRYSTKPIKPPQPVTEPIVMPHPASAQPLQNEELNEKSNDEEDSSAHKTEPILAMSQVQSTAKSATTLDPERFRIASTPSVVSSTRYTDIDAHEDLVFPPPPPDLKLRSMEVTCPYCLYALPSREVQNATRWKKHVLADLDPLVCLFDPCDQPDVLYSHTKDWLRHMRKSVDSKIQFHNVLLGKTKWHTEHWRCTAKSHGLLKFATFEEFVLHMKIDHGKNYTHSQIRLLAERKLQSTVPLFDFCPLCGGIPEEKGGVAHDSMIGHIVGHLRSLALKSLPPIHLDNDGSFLEEDDDSEPSRSTIKSFGSAQDSSCSLGSFLNNDDNDQEGLEKLEVPIADESTSEQIWSEVRSRVQPGKHLPTFGAGDDPIILAMLLHQSEDETSEVYGISQASARDAIPTGLDPFISSAYQLPQIDVLDGHDNLSEEEERLRLTDYKPVRFEKIAGQSSWENVAKTNIQGLSKTDIMSEIRRLDAQTLDITQKQASLPPQLSRHLTMELQTLNQNDLNKTTFEWTLAQIGRQLRETNPGTVVQHDLVQGQQWDPEPPESEMLKSYWDRASLTAYFKRSLRRGRAVGSWYGILKGQPLTGQNPYEPFGEPLPRWRDVMVNADREISHNQARNNSRNMDTPPPRDEDDPHGSLFDEQLDRFMEDLDGEVDVVSMRK